jgi:hypothetical protein
MQRQHLVAALPAIAGGLGQSCGVTVRFADGPARTDGRTIYIGRLPANDDVAAVLALGRICHESAHLHDTDMSVWTDRLKDCHTGFAAFTKTIANVIEDVRIEVRAIRRYPGHHLRRSELFAYLEGQGLVQPTEDMSVSDLLASALLMMGYEKVAGYATGELGRLYRDAVQAAGAGRVLALLDETLPSIAPLPDTAAAIDLAEDLCERIRALLQPPQPEAGDPQGEQPAQEQSQQAAGADPGADAPEQDASNSSQGESSSDAEQGSGSGDPRGDGDDGSTSDEPERAPESTTREAQGSSEANDSSNEVAADDADSAPEQNGSGASQGDASGSASESDPSDREANSESTGEGVSTPQSDRSASASGDAEPDQRADDGADVDNSPPQQGGSPVDGSSDANHQPGTVRGAGRGGAQELAPADAQAVEQESGDDARVLSSLLTATPSDPTLDALTAKLLEERVGTLQREGEQLLGELQVETIDGSPIAISQIDDEAASASGTLDSALYELLLGQQRSARRYGPIGNADGARLWELRTGNMNVLYRKKQREGVDTAVHILIDVSYSMGSNQGDQPMRHAMRAAAALSRAVDGIERLKLAMAVFPFRKSRLGRLKDYDEERPLALARMEALRDSQGSTPMAEGIMTFAMELALRSESRKLMFVATDGQPDNLAAATQAVAVAASAQIEVIGIGIGHDAPVAQVFERSVSIDGAHELAPALFALLEQRLVA